MTGTSSSDELRPDERWEWGVKHSQGIREEPSERMARESLTLMLARKRRYGVMAPYLVRRRVSDWKTVEQQP